jgi:transposase
MRQSWARHLIRDSKGNLRYQNCSDAGIFVPPVVPSFHITRTHKGEPPQQLLRRNPRLHIENFPSYAPELNPDEGVWDQAKRKLSNSCPKDVDELMEDIIRSMNGVRRSQKKLRGCIEQSELPSFLL